MIMSPSFTSCRVGFALAGLLVAGTSHADDNVYFDQAPSCTADLPPMALALGCRIDIPNGDFRGASMATGADRDDTFAHPWDGDRATGFGIGRSARRGGDESEARGRAGEWDADRDWPARFGYHDMIDHLKPWAYGGGGRPIYRGVVNKAPGVVITAAGGRIQQWIAVGPFDGTQAHATTFRMRVTYAPRARRVVVPAFRFDDSATSVGMALTATVADSATEHVTATFKDRRTAQEKAPASYIAKVTVPAFTPFSRIGLTVAALEGDAPLLVERVELAQQTDHSDEH
jgi:hypothetical protein